MNVQNISDAVISIVVVIIGVVTPFLAKFVKSNKTAQTLVDVLPALAKDAVVAMQKLGIETYIEGSTKKLKAVKIVKAALMKLGFTEADETIIANAVESAYASLISDGTLTTYTQAAAEPQVKEKTDELTAAQAALTAAQTALAQAQAQAQEAVSAASSAQSSVADQATDSAAGSATIAPTNGDAK